MREIDQMLKQWLPVNTLVREKFRNIIIKHIQLKMDESFNDARKIFERDPDSGKIRSREPMDYGNEMMVNPAVNSVPDDGVCEGEYVHTIGGTHPTQEDIIKFNIKENKRKEDGVCEGEYVHPTHPTQEEIINFNIMENKRKEVAEDNTRIKTIYYYIDLLEKLKDFDYWKEWKHQ